MPVTPTIGTVYRNNHKHIEDAQLHPPLGYRLAERDTFLSKSIHGENKWNDIMFQQPVIGFVTLGSSVVPSNGDRYIVLGSTVDGSYGNATPNSIVEYLTLDSEANEYNQWDYKGALTGMLTYVTGEDAFYFFDGSSWRTIGTGSGVPTSSSATATFTGSNVDTYIDLFAPLGNEIKEVNYVVNGLVGAATVQCVLHDGNPLNDVVIVEEISVEELLASKLHVILANAQQSGTGFRAKLLIKDADITAGTIKVIFNYIP